MAELREYIDMESYGVVPQESVELAWLALREVSASP